MTATAHQRRRREIAKKAQRSRDAGQEQVIEPNAETSPVPPVRPSETTETTEGGVKSLDQMNKGELYELAQLLDVNGRTKMNEDELREAIRSIQSAGGDQ